MTPCQASLRRVVARLAASPSSSDSVKMDARARPMSSILTGFFSGLMAKFLQFLHTIVSGSGSIGGRGTQSTACSGFHASGRTGGKSPCLYVDNCRFFLKFWNNEQLSCPCVLVSTTVAEQLACYHVHSDTQVFC
jgi:hypothetical protein